MLAAAALWKSRSDWCSSALLPPGAGDGLSLCPGASSGSDIAELALQAGQLQGLLLSTTHCRPCTAAPLSPAQPSQLCASHRDRQLHAVLIRSPPAVCQVSAAFSFNIDKAKQLLVQLQADDKWPLLLQFVTQAAGSSQQEAEASSGTTGQDSGRVFAACRGGFELVSPWPRAACSAHLLDQLPSGAEPQSPAGSSPAECSLGNRCRSSGCSLGVQQQLQPSPRPRLCFKSCAAARASSKGAAATARQASAPCSELLCHQLKPL